MNQNQTSARRHVFPMLPEDVEKIIWRMAHNLASNEYKKDISMIKELVFISMYNVNINYGLAELDHDELVKLRFPSVKEIRYMLSKYVYCRECKVVQTVDDPQYCCCAENEFYREWVNQLVKDGNGDDWFHE